MNSEEHIKNLDKRMKAKGMRTLTDMLENPSPNRFIIHAGMSDLESFREWLKMRHKEYLTMQAKIQFGEASQDDELFEWVLAHAAVFGEVVANFDAAVKK